MERQRRFTFNRKAKFGLDAITTATYRYFFNALEFGLIND
ncbi:hypothetical protein ADICYQ_4920 [Cyclobacterium qasimii M12-11B]|uniref:Uncharacterized protein n=1 Tax=Cyclobacterium qasimii M12-11B TaxID=641524 RepID=S7V9K8_9BACT|nr:hypothetical protein ADICYQ_4920 [Cyclobacterium qasimii M12-11B]